MDLRLRDLETYLSFMLDSLSITKEETVRFWSNPTPGEIKTDQTPVTELDRRLESILRDSVAKTFPSHGVIGEEFGSSNLAAEFQWIIDPIDGTMNLLGRIPTFGTLIALSYRGTPILGAIDHPIIGVRHYGGAEIGVFNQLGKLDPFEPKEETLATAIIGSGAPTTFNRAGAVPVLKEMVSKIPHLRIYYDCFAHSMSVSGGIAANVDYGLKIWDLAAAFALIRGRGGVVLNLGKPWDGDPSRRIGAVIGQTGIPEALYEYVAAVFSPKD